MGAAIKPIRGKARVPVGASAKRTTTHGSPIDKAKAFEVDWNNVCHIFEAARPYRDMCFLYAIGETDGPIKLGVSKDPVARLRTMQTGNPRRLRIEHILIGDQPIEKLLHELWEPFAIRSPVAANKPAAAPGTEWFRAEARPRLAPIFATAAQAQIDRLHELHDITASEMERIIRDAHWAHGFIPPGRDETRLLGRTVGYTVSRPSRI